MSDWALRCRSLHINRPPAWPASFLPLVGRPWPSASMTTHFFLSAMALGREAERDAHGKHTY